MRKDLKLLPWLTAEQALTALRDMTKTDLAFSDLISHCQYHNCNAFITASGLGGIADTPILIGEDDWSYKCFAHGPQRVLNAEVLVKTLGISKLYLQGSVRTVDDECTPVFKDCEWVADADPTTYPVLFKTSDIEKLAVFINGPAKDLDPRERTSLHKMISVLLAMTELDKVKPGAVHAVFEAAADEHSIDFTLDAETVSKHVRAVLSTFR